MKIYNVSKIMIMINNFKIKYLNIIAFRMILQFNIKMRKDNHKVPKKSQKLYISIQEMILMIEKMRRFSVEFDEKMLIPIQIIENLIIF